MCATKDHKMISTSVRAQWDSTHTLIQRSQVRFRTRSHTGVMDYDEACFMHLSPGVVHTFPKAVGV